MQTEIDLKLGTLLLSGGAADVLEASFTYDDADWGPPRVDYAVEPGGQAKLAVEQIATGRPAMRQGRSDWVVRLNPLLTTRLSVKVGAGKASIALGGMALEQLRIESGVGELEVVLRGEWRGPLQAFIKAGIGDITLRLPRAAGVRIQTSVGLGSIEPYGLTRDGSAYTNALFGRGAADLDITLEGGMGKIKLSQDSEKETIP